MSKKNILLIVLIITVTLFLTGSTYAFLTLNNPTGNASGGNTCFDINYTGVVGKYNNTSQELESSNNYSKPYTNDTGFASVKVSKATDCKIFSKINIKLHTNAETSLALLKEGALKYRVANASDSSELWTGSITTSSTTSSILDTTLATNVLITDTEKTYKIYLWVDTAVTYSSSTNYSGLKYSGYVYADADQTSTIKS